MTERWRKIPGFENYLVSDHGRVKSKGRYVFRSNRAGGPPVKHWHVERVLRPRINKLKYHRVVLANDTHKGRAGGKEFPVHILVAKAFVRGHFSGAETNHKDFNRGNNFYKNLEWVTHADNLKHAAEFGPSVGIFCGRKSPKWGNGRNDNRNR